MTGHKITLPHLSSLFVAITGEALVERKGAPLEEGISRMNNPN